MEVEAAEVVSCLLTTDAGWQYFQLADLFLSHSFGCTVIGDGGGGGEQLRLVSVHHLKRLTRELTVFLALLLPFHHAIYYAGGGDGGGC